MKYVPASITALLALAAMTGSALAQEGASGGQSLSQAASDPTASIMSFQLQEFYTANYHNSPSASGNRLQFRAAIPFTIGNLNNIARITIPYITDSPSGASGFSDMTLFNLVTFNQAWGRWGVGAVALLPTGESGLSAKKWGLGPALGFTARKKKVLWGAFNQNIFTVGGDNSRPDVNVSIIQPIFNYSLSNGWSTGVSEMSISYDWEQNKFTSLPLGIKLAKFTTIGKQKVQFIGSYERNFYDTGIVPRDLFSFTVKLLVPK